MIRDKILEIRKYMDEAKIEFESYLKSNAPLEERWETFVNAPKEMSNFMPTIPKDFPFPIDFEEFCENRHNTINILDIMAKVSESPEIFNKDLVHKFKIYDSTIKKVLMARNIKEFNYDWLGEK